MNRVIVSDGVSNTIIINLSCAHATSKIRKIHRRLSTNENAGIDCNE